MPIAKTRWLANLGYATALTLALASCNEQAPQQQKAAADAKPQVSAVTLRPQSVTITAEVPGRTAASLIAEVRPQVGGIIRARNFQGGQRGQCR